MKVAYDLPRDLCCDVNCYLSGDLIHDDGLACLAFEKLAAQKQAEGVLPRMVILWTDGAPNQFKFTRPVWFLSVFHKKFKFKFVPRWFFFQSCHGKGTCLCFNADLLNR
jgi:hypothetical protein